MVIIKNNKIVGRDFDELLDGNSGIDGRGIDRVRPGAFGMHSVNLANVSAMGNNYVSFGIDQTGYGTEMVVCFGGDGGSAARAIRFVRSQNDNVGAGDVNSFYNGVEIIELNNTDEVNFVQYTPDGAWWFGFENDSVLERHFPGQGVAEHSTLTLPLSMEGYRAVYGGGYLWVLDDSRLAKIDIRRHDQTGYVHGEEVRNTAIADATSIEYVKSFDNDPTAGDKVYVGYGSFGSGGILKILPTDLSTEVDFDAGAQIEDIVWSPTQETLYIIDSIGDVHDIDLNLNMSTNNIVTSGTSGLAGVQGEARIVWSFADGSDYIYVSDGLSSDSVARFTTGPLAFDGLIAVGAGGVVKDMAVWGGGVVWAGCRNDGGPNGEIAKGRIAVLDSGATPSLYLGTAYSVIGFAGDFNQSAYTDPHQVTFGEYWVTPLPTGITSDVVFAGNGYRTTAILDVFGIMANDEGSVIDRLEAPIDPAAHISVSLINTGAVGPLYLQSLDDVYPNDGTGFFLGLPFGFSSGNKLIRIPPFERLTISRNTLIDDTGLWIVEDLPDQSLMFTPTIAAASKTFWHLYINTYDGTSVATYTFPSDPFHGDLIAIKEMGGGSSVVTIMFDGTNQIENPFDATPGTPANSFTVSVPFISYEWKYEGFTANRWCLV